MVRKALPARAGTSALPRHAKAHIWHNHAGYGVQHLPTAEFDTMLDDPERIVAPTDAITARRMGTMEHQQALHLACSRREAFPLAGDRQARVPNIRLEASRTETAHLTPAMHIVVSEARN